MKFIIVFFFSLSKGFGKMILEWNTQTVNFSSLLASIAAPVVNGIPKVRYKWGLFLLTEYADFL